MILAGIFLQPEAKLLVGTIAVISPDDRLTQPLTESLQPDQTDVLPDLEGLNAGEAADVLLSEVSTSPASQVAVTELDITVVSMDESQIDEIKTGIRDGRYTARDRRRTGTRPRWRAKSEPSTHLRLTRLPTKLHGAPESSAETHLWRRGSLVRPDPDLVQRLTAKLRTTTVRLVEVETRRPRSAIFAASYRWRS